MLKQSRSVLIKQVATTALHDFSLPWTTSHSQDTIDAYLTDGYALVDLSSGFSVLTATTETKVLGVWMTTTRWLLYEVEPSYLQSAYMTDCIIYAAQTNTSGGLITDNLEIEAQYPYA